MNRVEKIEDEISKLTSEELAALRDWLIEFEATIWDQQFEADVKAGKLDRMAERALRDHAAGRSTKL